MSSEPSIRFGFVRVQDAGRSQMSAAFAERERKRRGLDGDVEIVTGGTHPADGRGGPRVRTPKRCRSAIVS